MPAFDLQPRCHPRTLPVAVRGARVVSRQGVDLAQPDVLGDRPDPSLQTDLRVPVLGIQDGKGDPGVTFQVLQAGPGGIQSSRMRPSSSRRYHVATVTGRPSAATVAITAGFGRLSKSSTRSGSGLAWGPLYEPRRPHLAPSR